MDNPKISIIVPVYKAEQYLRRCLDSIATQSFDSWECILVDDGSPDRSGEICDSYAARNPRFRVFHQKNGGASAARNLGLDNARGEWIAFVDSDDTVGAEYLCHLYKGVEQGSQLAMTNIRNFHIQIRECVTLRGVEFVQYFVENKIFALSGPYSKLYKKDIIDCAHIRFPVGIHMGEDGIFVVTYLNEIESVSLFTYTDYEYSKTDGSLSTRYYPFESEFRCFELWRNGMLCLFEKWNAFDDCVAMAWQERSEGAFARACHTLYRSGLYPRLADQVKLLKGIPQKYIEEYRSLPQTNMTVRRKLLKWLISHRWFLAYALIGKMDIYYSHK